MKYFSQREILNDISKELTEKPVISIRLTCPRELILESLYISLLNQIGLDEIRETIRNIIPLQRIAVTETRVRELIQLGLSDLSAKLFIRLTSSNSAVRNAAERYMFLDSTSADIKKLEVPRRIRTKIEKLNMFADIIQLLNTKYVRIFLWIDEMETIETLSGRDLSDMRFFLRSCLDLIPRNFTLFINTTKRAVELNSYLNYLGEAVKERIYRITELPTLQESDAREYVKALLNSNIYRSNEDKLHLEEKEMSFFPFDEDGITTLFHLLTGQLKREPTPRNINDALSSALEFSMQDKKLLTKLKNLETTLNTLFIKDNWDFIKLGVFTVE